MSAWTSAVIPAQAQHISGPSEPVPKGFDRTLALNKIFAELKAARDVESAKRISRRMITVFMMAPDGHAADLMNRGLRLAGGFSFDRALSTFNALVERNPEWPEAWNQRAFVHFRKRDFGPAVSDCEKVLELEPRHVGCLSGLAIVHIRHTRRYKAGRTVLRRVLELNPQALERNLLKEIPPGE